jgi:hypothetical protein
MFRDEVAWSGMRGQGEPRAEGITGGFPRFEASPGSGMVRAILPDAFWRGQGIGDWVAAASARPGRSLGARMKAWMVMPRFSHKGGEER